MRHRISGRKFGRNKGSRKALLVGLIKALIKEEQIMTSSRKIENK